MKLKVILLPLLLISLTSTAGNSHAKVNKQAVKEYLQPVRPGQSGIAPFWNGFAKKFIFAPSFEFQPKEGVGEYMFEVTHLDSGKQFAFKAKSPQAALSPIWNKIPVGKCHLEVKTVATPAIPATEIGTRDFFRDFWFEGPYSAPRRSYRDAAIIGMLYVHKMKAIQNWIDSAEPDMSYKHNTYPCKIISATVNLELLLARMLPKYRDEAMAIARNATEFLINQSRKEGEPLAFFPPTYYKNLIASKRKENQNKTMAMEAVSAAGAMLNMYDATGEERYKKHALGIADTYLRLQAEDGSFPIKVDFITGEPVNGAKASSTPVIRLFKRLEDQYGIGKYKEAMKRAEAWMNETALAKFDMTGQFEDVTVQGLKPYENLTNCTAAPYAQYLLEKESPTAEDIRNARDLINFSEDQFVYWDEMNGPDGFRVDSTPCVFEQYKYAMPVDSSACNVAKAWMSLYELTGDELALAKAKAMVDNITIVQDTITGMIPTTWRVRFKSVTFWVNCTYNSVCTLLRMEEIESKKK